MTSRIYTDLAAFYPLLDPVADHEAEAKAYAQGLLRHLDAPSGRPTLLEFGSGAGNNAVFMKDAFAPTLVDLAADILVLSEAQNPECEHAVGDMRTFRAGKTFDAVFIHDAICYMATEDDLQAAIENAFAHTRPGGVAAFAPDLFAEDFRESKDSYDVTDGERSLFGMEWMWAPRASASVFYVDYAFFLREGDTLHSVTERHVEGMFPRSTWHRLLGDAGFVVHEEKRPIEVEDPDTAPAYADFFFVCQRPN